MARQNKNEPEDAEDYGLLDVPVADTMGIDIVGGRTSQVQVNLPRGYRDLDDDDEGVVDEVEAGEPAAGEPRDDEADGLRVEESGADGTAAVSAGQEAPSGGPMAGESGGDDALIEAPVLEATSAGGAAVEGIAGIAEPTTAAPEASQPEPKLVTPRFVSQPASKSRSGGAERAEQLTSDRLIEPGHRAKAEPEGPWRSLIYRLTGGLINPGDSREAREHKELGSRIAAPLPGRARFVPVLSRKGGVGKTTVTTLLGMALADARDDRVIAVDANPDRGTLSERIAVRTSRTVRDVVRGHDRIRGYADISDLVARDETRLDVLASDTDPRIAHAFDDGDYRTVSEVAAQYYSLVLTDTGTGIIHSVMEATLDLADQLIVVAGMSVDESRLASETLTWLEAHDRSELVGSAVVVLNQSMPGKAPVNADELEAHFATRVRAVVRLPYDPALATGGAIVYRELRPQTRRAVREVAAHVVEGMRTAAVNPLPADRDAE